MKYTNGIPVEGSKIRFYKDIKGEHGIPLIKEGDTAICLGNSQIRMTSGNCKDWLFTLLISAPVEVIK